MRRAVATAPAQPGVGSVLLLAATARWAHHWSNAGTDALGAGAAWALGYDAAGACGGG